MPKNCNFIKISKCNRIFFEYLCALKEIFSFQKKKKKKKEKKIRHLYLDHGMQLGKFKNYSKVSRLILIFYGS